MNDQEQDKELDAEILIIEHQALIRELKDLSDKTHLINKMSKSHLDLLSHKIEMKSVRNLEILHVLDEMNVEFPNSLTREILVQEHLWDNRRANSDDSRTFISGNYTIYVNKQEFNDFIKGLKKGEDVVKVDSDWKQNRINVVMKYA